MTNPTAQWQRAKNIVADALELAPSARAAFVEQRLADCPTLRADVESLLATEATTGEANFLARPAKLPVVSHAPGVSRTGERVGAWLLKSEIGRGGMGVVYLAERADGAYAQRVAVKLLVNAAGAHAHELARERQALAGLNHPNIARLIDGGTDADGTPYLVMEYVAGESIATYCEKHQLTLSARVALVQKICAAVQSAHQQLLIHRDIKPANILVSDAGEVKLLDFGIARLLDHDGRSAQTTGLGGLLFTPRYASPEQVRGELVSVSADIYGIGALLYELLADSSPFARMADTEPANLAAIMRVVAEDEVALASTLARAAHSPFADQLTGDLDAILAKACAKVPAERYPSVVELAQDLGRFLDQKPIRARPQT